MITERLTNLVAVKDWLGITTNTSDAMLVRLIDAVSQYILQYISWDSFNRRTYTQNFRGFGRGSMLLRNWPVLGIGSVDSGGATITASTFATGFPGQGYYVSDERGAPQSINLQGYVFGNGVPSQVIYDAGYENTQAFTIPATPFVFTPTDGGTWSLDVGVTIAGVAAVKVTGTPTTGQYSVDMWGNYTFAAADTNKAATIKYGYTPAAISFAATEIVGEWLKRKDRIGILSKTLGGQETITFSQADMNKSTRLLLQPWVNVVPA